MPKILLPNLMFEEELDGRVSRISMSARRVVAELSPVIGMLCTNGNEDAGVVVVSDDGVPDDLPAALEPVRFATSTSVRDLVSEHADFCPWGWSPAAVLSGRQLQLDFDAPDVDAVRFINSREFLSPFDECFDPDSRQPSEPFGNLCWSLDGVFTALLRFARTGSSAWVIKSNFSQAARNRLTGLALPHAAAELAWLQQRFDAGQPVYAEPWVERLAEYGLQFFVPPEQAIQPLIRFEGATELLTNKSGRYLGSVIPALTNAHGRIWWQPAIEHGLKIARRAQRLGFCGALGIDCMAFRQPHTGRVLLRFAHDINGRLTMGRLALALQHLLQPDEFGIWCHVDSKSGDPWKNPFATLPENGVRILRTSPGRVGGRPVKHQTALLVSHDRSLLTQALRQLFGETTRVPFARF